MTSQFLPVRQVTTVVDPHNRRTKDPLLLLCVLFLFKTTTQRLFSNAHSKLSSFILIAHKAAVSGLVEAPYASASCGEHRQPQGITRVLQSVSPDFVRLGGEDVTITVSDQHLSERQV